MLLRRIDPGDEAEFIGLTRASIDLHHGWISAPTTPEGFQDYVRRLDGVNDVGFVGYRRDTGAIVCLVNIRQIAGRQATIGFGAFAHTAGKGFMRQAVDLALGFAFHELGLLRLCADVQPSNTACLHLIKRLGFIRERGVSVPIWISGIRRDHERWAITSEMREGRAAPRIRASAEHPAK